MYFCDANTEGEPMNTLIDENILNAAKSRDLIPLKCGICGKEFSRPKHQIQAKLKHGVQFFRCSKSCYKSNGKMVNCYTCGSPIYKSPRALRTSEIYFCSRKCSCTEGNKQRWENHVSVSKNITCDLCGYSRDYKTEHCPNCKRIQKDEEDRKITIGRLKHKYRNNGQFVHWYSSEVRGLNRKWNKDLLQFPCQRCGYKTHVELCHIHPISEFEDCTSLGYINRKENNLVLCPNHHWEFDNKIISLKDIPNRTLTSAL
jgi:hypothetical protein